jgi:muramidase (phage lysozyme)
MGGGGKGGSSSTTVSIPPEVLARYNAVNAQAQQLGGIDPTTGQPNTPYTPYTGEFVAPFNETQNAAVGNINAVQGMAQPYYNQATQYTQQAAKSFQPLSQQDIERYQNPFVQSVVDPTVKALQQQQGQQLSQQQTNAIRSGAFGGDRSGIERAVLEGQQNLALGQAISPLYSQAYQSGLGAAQQQQQVGGQGLMGAGAQLANLGAGAQNTALAGANAQLAAGTVGQQTQQALDTARYQQFLQQQGYPFQLTQFLANIAEGTGALSGSTTSTTQASDERLKHDIKKIGTANDGLPIYSFKYKGDDQIRIGFMAQDVEKKMPEAVGVMGGYKTVDYGKVSDANAKKHRAMGGGVWEPGAYNLGGREHHAAGNAAGGSQMLVDPTDWAALVQAHGQITNPYGAGMGNKAGTPGASGVVPSASLAVPKLVQANSPQMKQTSGVQDALKTGKDVAGLAESGNQFKEWLKKQTETKTDPNKPNPASGSATPASNSTTNSTAASSKPSAPDAPAASNATSSADSSLIDTDRFKDLDLGFSYGGVVPHEHFAVGGYSDPYKLPEATGEQLPSDVLKASEESKDESEREAPKPGKTGSGGGDSTMSDIGTAVGIIGTAAKILPLFSDARMKHNIKHVGKTHDDQNIYSYDFGDGRTQLGLLAQEVLHHKPEAVGKSHGVLTVDYNRATEDSHPMHKAFGGAADPYTYGGVIPREHHDGSTGKNDVGQTDTSDTSGGGGSDGPQYKIQPQNLEDMTEHRQNLIKAIYAPESGGRYDVLNGGETFDPSKGHPNRVGKGGESTAAGAGQFIKSTWDDVTGNAPMTKPYMDSATWTLASRDFNKRTGRDLDEELQKNGVTPEIKSALSDTWTGLKGPGPNWRLPTMARGDQTNRRNSSLGDVFGEMTPESVPTSSNFWVPLLSAVATAGASRAPTRGQALAEGLLGGISGYQTQVEQQSRLAKQAFDIMGNTFVQGQDKNGNIVYFNKNTGQQTDAAGRAAYGAQLLTNFGMDPKKWGFSGNLPANQAVSSQPMTTLEGPVKQPQAEAKPAVGEAANPKVAADPAQKAKDLPDLTQMGPSQLMEYAKAHKQDFGLTGDRDPDVILADIERLRRSGENAKMAGNMAQYNSDATLAQQKQQLFNDYLKQAVALQYEKNKQYALDDTTAQKLQNEEVTKRANGYINSLQSYQRIGDILSEYQGGQTEQAMQKLRGLAQAVGVAPDSWKRASNDFDELYKLTMTAALEGAQQNGFNRAPKSTVSNELSTQPGPSVNARAAYSLVGRQIADLNYQMAQDKEWLKQPRDTRPMVFKNNYVNSTQGNGEAYKGYVRDAFENHLAPPNKNVTRDDIENLRKTYGNFTPKGYEKAPDQQQQEIPVISNPADALKLQPGTTFKTPDGRLKVVPQRQGVQ